MNKSFAALAFAMLARTTLALDDPKPEAAPLPEQPVETKADRTPRIATHGNAFLKNATIVPVSSPMRGNVSIVVRGGKITELLPGDAPAPEGLTVIDCTGLFVSPGIIDCHSHIAIASGVNEGTDSVTAEVRIGDQVDGEDVSIFRALAGGATAAQLLHGSANAIGGQSAVVKLKYGRPGSEMLIPDAPRGIKFALGENPKRSGDETEISQRRYPATRQGVEATIRRAFIAGREYRRTWLLYLDAKARGEDPPEPRRDLRLETIADILDGKVKVHCHSYVASEILMLMRLAEEFGFRIQTFQHVLEGYKVAPEMAKHGAGASTFSDWWAYKQEVYDAIPFNAALLDEAGVVVSINSDSAEHIRRLNLEAAKAVKYGGTDPDRALAMVTLNPAKQLGIDQRTGSIDIGKDADLAIWNAHPLSSLGHCEMTLIEGEVYFQRAGGPTALDAQVYVRPDDASRVTGTLDTAPIRRELIPATTKSGAIAITHARLFPVSSAPIEVGTLVIDNGVITAIGTSDSVKVPDGARVIDGKGLSVYPGMIDAQTSLGLTEVSSVPGSSDTREQGDAQSDLRVSLALNHDSELIPVARINGITSAVVRPRGTLIQGQGALIRLDGLTWEELLRVDPLALYLNVPGFGRRSSGKGDDDPRTKEMLGWFDRAKEYQRVRDEAKQLGVAPPPFDPQLEALLPVLAKQRPAVFDADDEKAIVKAIELASRLGVKPIIAGGREAWKVAGLLKQFDVPVLLGPVLAMPSDGYDPYDAAYCNPAILERAGVRFALSTGDAANVRNLPFQAAMAASFGLDPNAALAAVTLRPAQILGVDHALGSLEVGKIADVVVADGDLLEIRSHIQHVFIHGREIPLESKQTKLYEKYRNRLKRDG